MKMKTQAFQGDGIIRGLGVFKSIFRLVMNVPVKGLEAAGKQLKTLLFIIWLLFHSACWEQISLVTSSLGQLLLMCWLHGGGREVDICIIYTCIYK